MKECEFCYAPESVLIPVGTPMLGWIRPNNTPFMYTRPPHYMLVPHNICLDCKAKVKFA